MVKNFKTYTLIILVVIIYHTLFDTTIENIDRSFTNIQFEFRPESKIDTNIITLYIDKDILDSLGRIPLKWNYYTRAIDGLSKYGAKAIGIDNLFDKNNPDYPTQASWLVSAIRKSKIVCVGGFFDKIKNIPENIDTLNFGQDSTKSNNITAVTDTVKIPSGENLDMPFTSLLKNAAGFGHLNFEEASTIHKVPLVLNNTDSNNYLGKKRRLIPALSLELARVYLGLPPDSVQISDDYISLNNDLNTINIPVENSQMMINYAGGKSSLNMVSMSDFLRIYNNKTRNRDELNYDIFKNKIVLIGLLGRRNTSFEPIPYDNRFPSIGVHANVLDTILRQRFLHKASILINILISIILSILIFSLLSSKQINFQNSALISITIVILYFIFTFILFKFNFILSLQPVIVSTFTLIGTGIYKYSLLQSDSQKIEREKHSIEYMLNRSRHKIVQLENSLNNIRDDNVSNSEIFDAEVYSNELSDLSFRFGDLSEYKKQNIEQIGSLGENLVFSKNSKIKKIADFTIKISPTNATVLLIGESGTGKELFARAIHNLSERNNKSFITVNCGALTDTLLESELFGHEQGSFTGANKQHKGYFEIADKGTIFLDEVTETNEFFQVKLLRVLQTGEFNRIGGNETLKVDVRVIAASNKDIERLVEEKKFREDLYYRLNVIKLVIPPLRERKSDLFILIRHFLQKENAKEISISDSVMQAIFNYEWPGNIRQLENLIKRAVILAKVRSK